VRIHLKLFGSAASQSGVRSLDLDVPEGAVLREVAAGLIKRYPQLVWLPESARPSRNLEYADWEDALAEGDEVSFLPPGRGGAG